jgi:hypothetical protein
MDGTEISAVIGGILFVLIGTVYGHKLYTEGAFSRPAGDTTSLDFLSTLILYLPNSLFVYGFIADIMNMKYHYSIVSITALVGMFINKYIAEYVVDAIAAVFSFIGSQFGSLPVVAQAAVAATAAAATAAAVPAVAAAASANPFAAAAPALGPTAAATGNPFVPAAAAAAAVVPPAVGAVPEDADGVPLVNPFRGGKKQKGGAGPLCSLPGFEWLENKTAPQGIIMSMTVLWYLMIELWDTGASSQSIALGVTTSIVFLLQSLVIRRSGCLTDYKYGSWSLLIALVMSITFAGSSYGIQKLLTGGPSGLRCPIGTLYDSASKKCVPIIPGTGKATAPTCPDGTVINSAGTMCLPILDGNINTKTVSVGGPNEKSDVVDDNDQFVCEAYRDGELVTSTIVE